MAKTHVIGGRVYAPMKLLTLPGRVIGADAVAARSASYRLSAIALFSGAKLAARRDDSVRACDLIRAARRSRALAREIEIRGGAVMGGHMVAAASGADTLRQVCRKMPVAVALEYVLSAYEELAGVTQGVLIDLIVAGFSPMEARIVAALIRPGDRGLSTEAVISQVHAGDPTGACDFNPATLRTHVCKIRRKLRKVAPGAQIATLWGHGYVLRGWTGNVRR